MNKLISRIKSEWWALILIICPYFYYFWFLQTVLVPTVKGDSFAYLWNQPFSLYYLTGRSLFQRVIYTILNNDLKLISIVHLLFFLSTELLLYFLLVQGRKTVFKVITAVLLCFAFSAYTFNISAIIISAEPMFICLIIAVPGIIALYRGKYRYGVIFLSSLLLIFSKNVAPYFLVLLLCVWLITSRKQLAGKDWGLVGTLTVIALGQVMVTNLFDTSININVLNNLYRRIFGNETAVQIFHTKYQMPVGDFVNNCKGEWVGVPCLGFDVVFVNKETLNYDLHTDPDGLVPWIKNKGQNTYLRYLLFDGLPNSIDEFNRSFRFYSAGDTIRFMNGYLGAPNIEILRKAGTEIGFLMIDPLTLLYNLLLRIGFGRVEIVIFYLLLGLFILYKFQPPGYFSLAIMALAGALGLFFLTLFGDAMEVLRHVFPSYLLILFGGLLYVISIIEMLFIVIQRRLLPVWLKLVNLKNSQAG
jgi:hypothetical protein